MKNVVYFVTTITSCLYMKKINRPVDKSTNQLNISWIDRAVHLIFIVFTIIVFYPRYDN